MAFSEETKSEGIKSETVVVSPRFSADRPSYSAAISISLTFYFFTYIDILSDPSLHFVLQNK